MSVMTQPSAGEEAIATIVPWKNPFALASYYCGVFSVIPVLGFLLGPIALVLGILGLRARAKSGAAHGLAHALVGVIAGGISTVAHYGVLLMIVFG